jgi:hypothetical protein
MDKSELYRRPFDACFFEVEVHEASTNKWKWVASCGTISLTSSEFFESKELCVEDFEKLAKKQCVCSAVTTRIEGNIKDVATVR